MKVLVGIFQIPVKVPLEAVGKNLENHIALPVPGFTANDSSLFPKISSSEAEKIMEEYHNGEGMLTYIQDGPQSYITSSKAEPGWPDILIQITPSIRVDDEEQRISLYSILGRPKSKGILTLDADKYKEGIRDDVQLALIDYQHLTHPDDIEVILEGNKSRMSALELQFQNCFRSQIYFPNH